MNWRNVPKIGCRLLLGILMITAGLGCSGGQTCSDEVRNGTETDVDCGGSCGKCELGLVCSSERDCLSGACGANGRCVPSGCINQTQEGNETGIDCGGDCPQCPGDSCTENQQCATGWCNQGSCSQPSCEDRVTNGRETGTDCGGPACPACPAGQPCLVGADCVSERCVDGVCAMPPPGTADACAVYNACIDDETNISSCVGQLYLTDQLHDYELGAMTLSDLVGAISLRQNQSCVAQAGADCDRALSCLNRNQAVRDCPEGTRCQDSSTLVNCVEMSTESGLQLVEITVRCNLLGLQCVDIGNQGYMHVCAYRESNVVDGVEVTCSGTIAKAHTSNASFRTDCGLRGAVCLPGTYQQQQEFEVCQGTGLACDPATFLERCSGNRLVGCLGGKEANTDCTGLGLVCAEQEGGAGCNYSTCDPGSYAEQCTDGTVSYCDPEGERSISCTGLGFAGCISDLGSTRCTN